jgi:hypothetical protein
MKDRFLFLPRTCFWLFRISILHSTLLLRHDALLSGACTLLYVLAAFKWGVKTFGLARSLRFHRHAFVPAPAAKYFRLCREVIFPPTTARYVSAKKPSFPRLRQDTFIVAEKSSFHPSRRDASLTRSQPSRACGKIFSSLPRTLVQI